jgi:hypothetical protein
MSDPRDDDPLADEPLADDDDLVDVIDEDADESSESEAATDDEPRPRRIDRGPVAR